MSRRRRGEGEGEGCVCGSYAPPTPRQFSLSMALEEKEGCGLANPSLTTGSPLDWRGSMSLSHPRGSSRQGRCCQSRLSDLRRSYPSKPSRTPSKPRSTSDSSTRKLCVAPYNKTVDWIKWYIFWADKHAVANDHEDNNYRLAKDGFLSKFNGDLG